MDAQAYIDMAEIEGCHWWFAARRKILQGIIRDLELPADARILEAGAGTGGNLRMLSGFGQVDAMEMDADASAYAEKSTGSHVEVGSLPSDIPFGGKYDLICMFDVPEHVEDDAGALTRLASMLEPGGHLVISVPAYTWLWSDHDVVLHHFRRYSRSRLRSDLTTAGLHVCKLSYFNSALFPAAAAARLMGKVFKRQPAGMRVPPAPLNAVLKRLFGAEAPIIRRANLPFGLSVLAVASLQ